MASAIGTFLLIVVPYGVGYLTPPVRDFTVNLFVFDQILVWCAGFAILLLALLVGWVGYNCFKVAVRVFDLWRESK